MPEQFMDTKTAAAYLGLSPATLTKWRVFGGGPRYRKHGRLVRYAISDLEAWSAAGQRSTTSDPGPTVPKGESEAADGAR